MTFDLSRIREWTAHAKDFARRTHRLSFFLGLGASLLLGGIYVTFAQGGTSSTVTATYTTVTRQTLLSSVQAAGKVTFSNEQQLKFNQKGTVAKVSFKEGDKVKKGQIIAELDQSTILADIRQAQLSVGASALQLQQLQAQKNQTIIDAQNSLQQSQNTLAVSQQKLPTDLAAAERSVQDKQAALDQATLDLAKQKSTELQTLAQTAQSILTSSDHMLDALYSTLTHNRATRPPSGIYTFDVYELLWNDGTAKQAMIDGYYDASKAAEAMHTTYGTSLTTTGDPAVIRSALNDAGTLAAALSRFAGSAYVMLQGATTDMSNFTAADLEAIRSTVNGDVTTADGLVAAAQTAQTNLLAATTGNGIPSVTLQQKQNAVTSAQSALQQAKDTLAVLQTQTPGTLQQQQGDLQSKQQALDSATANTDINIRLRQNSLAQAATSLQKIQKTIQDYQLTAPFDGQITHIDYKVGDNLLDTGDTEYLILQNHDFILVTIPLDQVDVVRVKKGMSATITLDALPGQEFQGAIDTIDPTPITTSGVVSYNVQIKLATPKDLTILSGMTATVTIETSRKDNVLAVPNLALRTLGGETAVQKADGTSVTVETGMTDGQYTEILSGLKEGDSILSVNISRAKSSAGSNTNAASQLLRGLGGGGGPPGGFTGGGGGAGGGTRTGGGSRGN